MTSIPRTRLNRLMDLAPRRFHISSDPPFGGGLVIFAHENEDFGEDGLEMFMLEKETIRNCKPGIWASRSRELDPEQVHEDAGDCDREALLFWVAEGTIDISQSVKEWTKYDEESRRVDEAVKVENIVPKGTKWRRYGTHFDDGGVCCVISAEYLTHDAARIIQFGSKDSEEELDFGTYLEALCTCGIAMSADPQEGRFTLGGMNCMFSDTSRDFADVECSLAR